MREVLADDYTLVTADGRIRTKEQKVKETLQATDQIRCLLLPVIFTSHELSNFTMRAA